MALWSNDQIGPLSTMMLAYSDQIMRVLFPDAIFRPTPYSNGEIDPVQPDLASRSLPPACGLGIGELLEAKICAFRSIVITDSAPS